MGPLVPKTASKATSPYGSRGGSYFSFSFSNWEDAVEKATLAGPTHTAFAHTLSVCVTAFSFRGPQRTGPGLESHTSQE